MKRTRIGHDIFREVEDQSGEGRGKNVFRGIIHIGDVKISTWKMHRSTNLSGCHMGAF